MLTCLCRLGSYRCPVNPRIVPLSECCYLARTRVLSVVEVWCLLDFNYAARRSQAAHVAKSRVPASRTCGEAATAKLRLLRGMCFADHRGFRDRINNCSTAGSITACKEVTHLYSCIKNQSSSVLVTVLVRVPSSH
jgi:hypothetical protein